MVQPTYFNGFPCGVTWGTELLHSLKVCCKRGGWATINLFLFIPTSRFSFVDLPCCSSSRDHSLSKSWAFTPDTRVIGCYTVYSCSIGEYRFNANWFYTDSEVFKFGIRCSNYLFVVVHVIFPITGVVTNKLEISIFFNIVACFCLR